MTHHEKSQDLAEILKGKRFVMYTTVADGGALVSRPMTIQEVEGDTVRFIAQDDNAVTKQSEGKQLNLAIMDGSTYVSLTGSGGVERDLQKKKELWDRLTEAYAGEPEDPNNIILEVTVTGGEYWEGGNPVVELFGLAKAAVTGKRPDSGEHGTVEA